MLHYFSQNNRPNEDIMKLHPQKYIDTYTDGVKKNKYLIDLGPNETICLLSLDVITPHRITTIVGRRFPNQSSRVSADLH